MLIKKPFRKVNKGFQTILSTYKDTSLIDIHIQKYGGLKVNSLEVSDAVADLIEETGGEVCTVLKNARPKQDDKFLVAVQRADQFYPLIYFDTLTNANTFAKTLIFFEEAIVVLEVRRRPSTINEELIV